MKKWLREWLTITVDVKYPEIKEGEPIRLTEDQFRRLVLHLNEPDLFQAKSTRRMDGLEMRITRLDESIGGALMDLRNHNQELGLKISSIESNLGITKE